MANTIGNYLSGFLILVVYSYLYKDNKLYSYAEHIYVGFVAAQAVIQGWQNIRDAAIRPLQKGQWILLVPVLVGLLLYARFFKGVGYLIRLPMAFMMGVAAGTTITGVLVPQLIAQVKATMLPLTGLNNVVMVVGTATTLAFFLFIPLGKKQNGGLTVQSAMSSVGRATMMAAFGSSYGYIVMSRLSYLVARLQFLLGPSWGHITK